MREILFRGKRIDNGKWIVGGYYSYNNKSYIVIATRYIPDTRDWDVADYYEENPVYKPTFIEVIPETVGQYTGVNVGSEKLFEGDVITMPSYGGGRHKSVIYFKNGKFAVDGSNYKFKDIAPKHMKKIGNIHDNPDLLKGGNNG